MKWLVSALILVAGAGLPLQAGLNAKLRDHLEGPFEVATISSVLTTVLLALGFAGMLALGKSEVSLAEMRDVPWYLWLGGSVGAYLIVVTLVAANVLDAALLLGLLVLGQMVASLVFDHFGLLSFDVKPVTVWRVVGVALICAGVFVIQRN